MTSPSSSSTSSSNMTTPLAVLTLCTALGRWRPEETRDLVDENLEVVAWKITQRRHKAFSTSQTYNSPTVSAVSGKNSGNHLWTRLFRTLTSPPLIFCFFDFSFEVSDSEYYDDKMEKKNGGNGCSEDPDHFVMACNPTTKKIIIIGLVSL